MKMKKIILLFLSTILVMGIVSVSTISASASTRGGTENWKGMQVWTNTKGFIHSITLSQTPAIYKYSKKGKVKYEEVYKSYLITCKPICKVDGSKTKAKKVVKWLDSDSLTIYLDKGVYYEVDIVYYGVSSKRLPLSGVYTRSSSWRLSKVKNCSNYR